MAVTLAAVRKSLGVSVSLVDDDVLEYLSGTVDTALEEGQDDDDVIDAIAPLLDECLSLHDGAAINDLCRTILRTARADRAPGASAMVSTASEGAIATPFKLNDALSAQDKAIGAAVKQALNVKVNFNSSLMSRGTNALIDDESEETMARRMKTEKRGAKLEKRAMRREKVRSMQNEETLQSLTREPVVLHWQGVRKGTSDIVLRGVSMQLGALELLSEATFTLVFGRRYGLIGRNGIGKTTLLKHLSAKKFEGIPPHLQILHIEQEVPGGSATVLECVLATDVERTELLAEEAELQSEHADVEDGDDDSDRTSRLSEVWERLKVIDADSAPARAAAILSGLGFEEHEQGRTTASFSGGWRMRVALARALFICPDVLLLDEPTNHLDLHAVLWLEEYLQSWDKTLIVVSHARSFLNAVVTDILHFQNKDVRRFKGDYDAFEDTRAEELRQHGKKAEALDKQRAHQQAFIDRFRCNAKRASMVQSRIKALGRMEVMSEVLSDPSLQFAFQSPEPLQPPVLQINDCCFSYAAEAPNIFSGANVGIDLESRIAVVGPNGAGKSTLLKVIFGELEATSGEVRRSGKLRLGKFSQHHVDQLDLSVSALEAFQRAYPQATAVEIRKHLGGMGLGGNLALQPMRTLSGGQKSRAAFAQIMWQRPHILLLDEPSNHLDLDAVEALINALNDFEGGLLVVSHDEHLITNVCDTLWIVDNGKVYEHGGDFNSYRKQQLAKSKLRAVTQ